MSSRLEPTTAPPLPSLGELGSDLLHVSSGRRCLTLLLPFLAMGLYVLSVWYGSWVSAVASVMMLSFVTYGSTSHDLVHRTLHLAPRWNDSLLSLIELLSLRSGTAYRLSHLHHHRHLLDASDIEGEAAHGTLLQSLSGGTTIQFRLWLWAWKRHEAQRSRLLFEAAGIMALIAAAVAVAPWSWGPLAYVFLVVGGSWLFPLITVYIPHEARAESPLAQTRLFRSRIVQWIAFEHLYHLEHHLYPAVPHHHWKTLAKRLDPYFERAQVKAYL